MNGFADQPRDSGGHSSNQYIAFHITYEPWKERRAIVVEFCKVALRGTRWLEVRPPCLMGFSKRWTPQNFPTHDVPCPCGRKNHWLVKWKEADLLEGWREGTQQ